MIDTPSEPKQPRRAIRYRFELHPPDSQRPGHGHRYSRIRFLCCDVLERMPKEAQELVLDSSAVVWIGRGRSTVRPSDSLHGKPFVVFLDSDLDSYEPDVATGMVAHEFAHVYLEHVPSTDGDGNTHMEVAADDLACRWGFASELAAMRRLCPLSPAMP